MGRLAGPATSRRPWREELEYRRELRTAVERRKPPIAYPPARRRQMALLWFILTYHPEGMIIAARHRPPLTPDMRDLIKRNFLFLKREGVLNVKIARRNWVVVTDAGRNAVERNPPSMEDREHIFMAFRTGSLR